MNGRYVYKCLICKYPCYAIVEHETSRPDCCLFDHSAEPNFQLIDPSDIKKFFEIEKNDIEIPEGYLKT